MFGQHKNESYAFTGNIQKHQFCDLELRKDQDKLAQGLEHDGMKPRGHLGSWTTQILDCLRFRDMNYSNSYPNPGVKDIKYSNFYPSQNFDAINPHFHGLCGILQSLILPFFDLASPHKFRVHFCAVNIGLGSCLAP